MSSLLSTRCTSATWHWPTIDLSDSCYIFQLGVSKGDTLVSGFMQIFPEHRGCMPEAHSARGHRLVKGGEGGPLASESIAAIAIEMTLTGALMPALALLLSEDCYLREQDWHQFTREDVSGEDGRVCMILGVRDRGLKVKTGSNQGVTLDRAYIADILMALVASLEYGDPVFPFDPIQYRKEWWQALEALGLLWVGPPHNVRHSGPSADIAYNRRGLAWNKYGAEAAGQH